MIYADNYKSSVEKLNGIGGNAPKNMEDMKVIYGDMYSDEKQIEKYRNDNPTKMYPVQEPVHWGFSQHCHIWLYHRDMVARFLGEKLEEFPLDEQWKEIFDAKSANDQYVKRNRWKKDDEEKHDDKPVMTDYDRWLATIPPRFKDAELASFPGTEDMQNHIVSGGSLLMVGPTGTKKSTFIWAMAKFISKEIAVGEVRVIKLRDLLSEVRTSGNDWTNAVKDMFCKDTWLFIDEVDKVDGSQSDGILFFDLIDARYEQKLSTVCVGNGTVEKMKQKLGDAAISRLIAKNENGMVIRLDGPDMRNK